MTDLTDPNVAASTDDWQAEPAQSQSPAPEEPAAAEQCQARIEELTQERDQARRELDQARQELERAHHVQPRAVGPDHPSRCSVCLKQRNAVKAMFTSPRRHHQFSLCNECIDEMHQASIEFIAKEGSSMQPSLASLSAALDASRCRHSSRPSSTTSLGGSPVALDAKDGVMAAATPEPDGARDDRRRRRQRADGGKGQVPGGVPVPDNQPPTMG